MANISLLHQTNFLEITRIGFLREVDDSGDPRGTVYTMENEKFKITIDCSMDVTLERRNPDTDSIKIEVDDLFDLRQLINFIQY
jgi:hypothetical protein